MNNESNVTNNTIEDFSNTANVTGPLILNGTDSYEIAFNLSEEANSIE